MAALNEGLSFASHNPYLDDTTNLTGNTGAYYQAQTNFGAPQQPVSGFVHAIISSNVSQLQYHLYAPVGPHKEGLLDYQKGPHDFFIPNDLREELQKKSEATHQVMQSEFSSAYHRGHY